MAVELQMRFVMIWSCVWYFSALSGFVLLMCSQRCFAEAGRGFPGWLELLPLTHLTAHLIISGSTSALVFSPPAARLFPLVTVVYVAIQLVLPLVTLLLLPVQLLSSGTTQHPAPLPPAKSPPNRPCLLHLCLHLSFSLPIPRALLLLSFPLSWCPFLGPITTTCK